MYTHLKNQKSERDEKQKRDRKEVNYKLQFLTDLESKFQFLRTFFPFN